MQINDMQKKTNISRAFLVISLFLTIGCRRKYFYVKLPIPMKLSFTIIFQAKANEVQASFSKKR
jgi:hypothetical protein